MYESQEEYQSIWSSRNRAKFPTLLPTAESLS